MWHAFVRQKNHKGKLGHLRRLFGSPQVCFGQVSMSTIFSQLLSGTVRKCKRPCTRPAQVLLGVTISELNFNVFASALSSSFGVDQTNQSWRPSCCGRSPGGQAVLAASTAEPGTFGGLKLSFTSWAKHYNNKTSSHCSLCKYDVANSEQDIYIYISDAPAFATLASCLCPNHCKPGVWHNVNRTRLQEGRCTWVTEAEPWCVDSIQYICILACQH